MATSLPSYARPTAASNHRARPRAGSFQDIDTHRRMSDRLLQGHNAKTADTCESRRKARDEYSASATTSPRPARYRNVFKFLDLPAELRNRVYEQLDLGQERRCTHLHNAHTPLAALPSLLQANKQICQEAGSYYFSATTRFDILIDITRLYRFRAWLQLIGRSNRELLAENSNVHFRLVRKRLIGSSRQYQFLCRPSVTVRRLTFDEGAFTLALDGDFQECVKLYPQLRGWKTAGGSLYGSEMWRDTPENNWYEDHFEICVADLQAMRDVMKSLMQSLGFSADREVTREVCKWLKVKEKYEDHYMVLGRNGKVWDVLK